MYEMQIELFKIVDQMLVVVLVVMLVELLVFNFIKNRQDKEELKNKIIYYMTAELFGASLMIMARFMWTTHKLKTYGFCTVRYKPDCF